MPWRLITDTFLTPKVPTLTDIVYYTIMHTIQVIRLLSFILLFLTEYHCKSVHCVNSELGNIGIMCLRGLTLKAHNRTTKQPHFQLTCNVVSALVSRSLLGGKVSQESCGERKQKNTFNYWVLTFQGSTKHFKASIPSKEREKEKGVWALQ